MTHLFATSYNPDKQRWEAHWNGLLYALATTEGRINYMLNPRDNEDTP